MLDRLRFVCACAVILAAAATPATAHRGPQGDTWASIAERPYWAGLEKNLNFSTQDGKAGINLEFGEANE
jgi:hypothetical protein